MGGTPAPSPRRPRAPGRTPAARLRTPTRSAGARRGGDGAPVPGREGARRSGVERPRVGAARPPGPDPVPGRTVPPGPGPPAPCRRPGRGGVPGRACAHGGVPVVDSVSCTALRAPCARPGHGGAALRRRPGRTPGAAAAGGPVPPAPGRRPSRVRRPGAGGVGHPRRDGAWGPRGPIADGGSPRRAPRPPPRRGTAPTPRRPWRAPEVRPPPAVPAGRAVEVPRDGAVPHASRRPPEGGRRRAPGTPHPSLTRLPSRSRTGVGPRPRRVKGGPRGEGTEARGPGRSRSATLRADPRVRRQGPPGGPRPRQPTGTGAGTVRGARSRYVGDGAWGPERRRTPGPGGGAAYVPPDRRPAPDDGCVKRAPTALGGRASSARPRD